MSYQLTDEDKEWIAYLRANPDKRIANTLGRIENGELNRACCLGARHWLATKTNFASNCTIQLQDSNDSYKALWTSYKTYNLRGECGQLNGITIINGELYSSLAAMNDRGYMTWPEIADFIESNPDKVFINWSTES
jgi:hypothetical protein